MQHARQQRDLPHTPTFLAIRLLLILLAIMAAAVWMTVAAQDEAETPTPPAPATTSGATIYLPLIQNVPSVQASAALPQAVPHLGLIYTGLQVNTTGKCDGLFQVAGTDYCTHGPDLPPAGLNVKQEQAPLTTAAGTLAATAVCDGNGTSGNRVQVLYVRASDRPDRYNQYLTSFRQWANDADQIYYESAVETGGTRRIRFVHDTNCVITVNNVVVSAAADDDFSATITAVQAQGYNLTNRKYMMFVDNNVYCGIGGIRNDDSPQQSNTNNFGPSYGRSDNGCWNGYTIAHELMHNLGGVQRSAPNSTNLQNPTHPNTWHCSDEYDIMCYDDAPGVQTFIRCPNSAQEYRLDCNHNDYYHTNPPAGSYLATRWNSANNQFLIQGVVPPDPDDGRTLSAGQSLNGTIDPASDQDTYYIDLTQSKQMTLQMNQTSSSLDSYLILYGPTGNEIARDDDSGGNRNSLINQITLSQTGRYRLVASSYNGASTGGYTISRTDVDVSTNIFADSFESGNTAAWSFVNNSSRVSVNSQAARIGSYGAQVTIDQTTAVYVADNRPTAEPRYRARFYFHPNSITLANKITHPIFYGVQGSGTSVMRIGFQKASNKYQVRAGLLNDGTTWKFTSWYTISNAWHVLEVDWLASTSTSAKNGSLTFWLDGVQKATVTKIDNDTRRIDASWLGWLGPTEGLGAGTQGSYYFDDFVSRRLSYIGPASSAQSAAIVEPEFAAEGISEAVNYPAITVSTTMQPGEASRLTSELSGLQIDAELPVNTSSEALTGLLVSTDTQTMPDGYRLLGEMFTLQLQGADSTFTNELAQPATLTINYATLFDGAMPAGEISLQAWNHEAEVWEMVPATVNTDAHTISAQITQPATLAVWQKEQGGLNTLYLPTIQR